MIKLCIVTLTSCTFAKTLFFLMPYFWLYFHIDYHPPTPSPMTGFHRYQFMVFEQPSDVMVSLTDEEKSSRGKHCNITNYTLSSQTTTALSACAVVVKTDHTTLWIQLSFSYIIHLIGFCKSGTLPAQ